MGRIGQIVADRARAFKMKVIYFNRNKLPKDFEKDATYYSDLKSMLPNCDYISLHTPATAETKNIINSETLKLFPKHSVFINTSRGSTVDDDALIEALKNKKIICFRNNLMPTVSTFRECLICNNIGKSNNFKFSLHLKVDTGMSRLGFECDQFNQQFNIIKSLENIAVKGIYSHLACADEKNALNPKSSTQLQKEKFQELLKIIDIDNTENIKIHLANSAGMILGKDFHFDMVRVGLSMYGYSPLANINENLFLKPALFLKAKVTFVRTIEKGIGVSYGNKFVSDRKTKLAVLSIGYADGIIRNLSGKISLIHNKKLYTQVGSITMDQMMVDITDSNDIEVGSTMLLLGSEGDKSISPIDWADKCNSIPWEILCSFKNRLPRVQVD